MHRAKPLRVRGRESSAVERSPGLSRAVALLALLVLPACADTFQPIEPSEQGLAVWGYLDASADTQWIRVSVMRPTLFTSPDSISVKVTLENLGDGRLVPLRQRTVRFSGIAAVDSAGVTAHNFWTTEPIRPGATYRLRAEPAVGQVAEAMVRIPASYDMDLYLAQPWTRSGTDSLRLTGLQYIGFVNATSSYYYANCPSITETKPYGVPPRDTVGTVRSVSVSKLISGAPGCGTAFVTERRLWVAGSGAAWPFGDSWSSRTLGGGRGPTNVTNGSGFVGGVLTKTIPYESCDFRTNTGVTYCRLHYDSTSVTLTGTVTDPRCGWGVRRASVKLMELDPKGSEPAKVRSTVTDTLGRFRIGALVGGVHYALTVHRDERPPDAIVAEYDDYTTTLLFTPGQQIVHDLDLARGLFPCPAP